MTYLYTADQIAIITSILFILSINSSISKKNYNDYFRQFYSKMFY